MVVRGEEEEQIPVVPNTGEPADPFLIDFLQKKGLVQPKMIERTPTIPRMKDGRPDNIQGKRIVRDIDMAEEMSKDIDNWLAMKGLKAAPEPPKQPVPPELQAIVDKQAAKLKDIVNINVIGEVLPPLEGEKYPRIIFNKPSPKEKSLLRQFGDIMSAKEKWTDTNLIIPHGLQTSFQKGVDAIPKMLSGGYVPSWTGLLMDAIYPGSSEEFTKMGDEALKKSMGYFPEKGLLLTETTAEYMGLAPVFGGLGKLGGAAAAAVTQRAALQSIIRGATIGAAVGGLRKPEGQDTFLKRIKQVPPSVLFFATLDLGMVTVGQLAAILNWNKNYTGYAFSGGGRKAGYGPGVKIEGGGEFTREDIQALYNKMKAKAAGQDVGEWTEMDEFIIGFVNKSPGWKNAINNGYVTAFGRKPGMMDIFRKPESFMTEPTVLGRNQLPPGPVTEQPTAPEAPPNAARPRGTMLSGAAPPSAAPGAAPVKRPVPSTALGLPSSPMGRRAGGEENEEARAAIDVAIGAYKGDMSAEDYDLDKARSVLEHENYPSVGGPTLQAIQERIGAFKYWAIIEPQNKADLLVNAEIGDMISTYNDQDNPIEWPASVSEDGEFVLGDNDPDDIRVAIDRLNQDLTKYGKAPIKVTVGYGTSLEEAEANLINTKTRPAAAPVPAETTDVTPAPAADKEPIYHYTQPENINKIYEEGFISKRSPLFSWTDDRFNKTIKPGKNSGTLYFTRDKNRYSNADIPVGEGKGDKDHLYYDREKNRNVRIPLGLKNVPLKPIEATIRDGAKVLVLDSLGKYKAYLGLGKLRGSLPKVVKQARHEGYDILEIRNVPGEWDLPGINDGYHHSVGKLGDDDFFVFNRKAIKIPEMSRYRTNKLMASRAKAQMKRGLPGWPKGAVELWDDIHKITGGLGLKPMLNKSGMISDEFSQNVPKFMWNVNGMAVDAVAADLAKKYMTQEEASAAAYDPNADANILLDELGKTLGIDWRAAKASRGQTGDGEFFDEPTPEDIEDAFNAQMRRIRKEGESVAKKVTPTQLQFNLDMKEKPGGTDPSIYKAIREQGAEEGQNLQRHGEERRGARRGSVSGDPQRSGPGVFAQAWGRAEQQATPGAAAADQGSVGVQQGGERGGIDQSLKPDRKQLGLPMKATYGPIEPAPPTPSDKPWEVPDESQAFISGDEFALKQEKAKTPIRKAGARKPLTEEQKELVRTEVIRLTKNPFFPKNWVGNEKYEVDDNIQNLFVWVMEHWDPAKGPVENLINKAKKFFYKGRVPMGEHAKALAALKAEYGSSLTVPTAEGDMELNPSNEDNIVGTGPQSVTKGNLSNTETPMETAPDAREIEKVKEDKRIHKIYRDVARIAAGLEGQQTLPGLETMDASALEEQYYEIMKSRLESDEDLGEGYRELADRLKISHEHARNIYEEKLLPELRKHPAAQEIKERLGRKMVSHMDSEKVKGMRPGFLLIEGDRIKKFYDKWFSSRRGQSIWVDTRHDFKIGQYHRMLFDMAHYSEDLLNWLESQPKNLRDTIGAHVADLLRGDISGGTGYADIRNATGIPPKAKRSLIDIRGLIDLATTQMDLLGVFGKYSRITAQRNFGKYLERRYKAFEEKYWDPTPDERAGIKQELMTAPMPGVFTRPLTSEEADVYIDEMTDKIRNKIYKTNDIHEKQKLIDEDNLLHKQSLSPAFRKYLGEYTDGYWLAVDGYNRMASQIANAKFIKDIADHYGPWSTANKGGIYTDNPDVARMHEDENGQPQSWEKWRFPNDVRYGFLRNKYVPQELYRYMTEDVPHMTSEQERFIEYLVTMPYKWVNTIGSFPTWQRNIIGDIEMSIVSKKSVINPVNLPKYLKAIDVIFSKGQGRFIFPQMWAAGSNPHDEYGKLIESGHTETGFFKTEIPESVRKVINPQTIQTPKEFIQRLISATIGVPIDAMGYLYNLPDQIFRIAGKYINDDLGMSIEENIQDINASYPDYRKNPRFVEPLKRAPYWLGVFISFRVNMARIAMAQAGIAWRDMAHGSTMKQKVRGISRLWWLGVALTGGYIASELSKRHANIDPALAKELEEYMQPWRRHRQYVYYRDKIGRIKMLDVSNPNPFSEIFTAGKSLLSLDAEGLAAAANTFESPVFDVLSTVINGRDKYGRKYESTLDAAAALLNELYVPASSPLPDLRKIFEANFGPGAVKFDPNEIDPETGMPYKIEFRAKDPETGKDTAYRLNKEGGSIRPGLFTGKQIANLIDAYNNNPRQFQKIRSLSDDAISLFSGIRGGVLDPEEIMINWMLQKKAEVSELTGGFSRWMQTHQSYSKEDKDKEFARRLKRADEIKKEIDKAALLMDKLKMGKFRMYENEK